MYHYRHFSSHLDDQDILVNNLPPSVIDILQNDTTIFPDVVCSIVQHELATPLSTPTPVALELCLRESLTIDNNNTFTNILTYDDPVITSLLNDIHDLQSPSQTTQRKSGFGQPESMDFHASKLETLLTGIVLNGDTLLDLELFFDSILSNLESVMLTSSLTLNTKN